MGEIDGHAASINFWRGRRVLVTGHTGFKGTWLVLLLKQLGASVAGFALPAEQGSLFEEVCPVLDQEYTADLSDYEAVQTAVQRFQPEIILHLGAVSFIQAAVENPHRAFSTNVMGLVNLLEAARNLPCLRSIVVVTSDKCYKNKETDIPYTEAAELGAQDPYSTTKACQELVVESYRKTYYEKSRGPLIATARASNVLGGGDFHRDRLVPYLLQCFVQGKTAKVRNPKIIRPWQDVLDVLSGYLRLSRMLYENHEECASPFNFGPDAQGFVSVEQILEILTHRFPAGCYEIAEQQYFQETKILKIANDKAKRVLGWKSKFSLVETLNWAAEFELRRNKGEKTGVICQGILEDYIRGLVIDDK